MLVSCILCTRDCRRLLPMAIASYLSQDWPEKELLILDDGADVVEDMFQAVPNARYLRVTGAENLAQKRNQAARLANGEILIHFDSDDWSAAGRVRTQVELLQENPEAKLTGYHRVHYWDEVTRQASRYDGNPGYVFGPTMAYYREFALEHPWPKDISYCEDNAFWEVARGLKAVVSADGCGQIVCRMHAGNERKPAGRPGWPHIQAEELPAQFLEAIGRTSLPSAPCL